MLRTKLPQDILSYIEEFIGPCPVQKSRKDALLTMIKPGRIGIPYWTIQYYHDSFKPCFHYCFIIPNCDYFENLKVFHEKFDFKQFETGDGLPRAHERYDCITIEYTLRQTSLKKLLFIETGTKYFVSWEGADRSCFPLSYMDANDYDILYILKYSRGVAPKEIYDGIVRRFKLTRTGSKNEKCQNRILKKVAGILGLSQSENDAENENQSLNTRKLGTSCCVA
jgi:hypothetical protein